MITLTNINKTYITGDESLHVLKDVSLNINKGDFVGIMGESGSGKSTLINIIGFIDQNYKGEYNFNGNVIKKSDDSKLARIRNKSVGFVFQQFNLIDNYTIKENVELPLLYGGLTPKQAEPNVLNAIEQVGIIEKVGKYPRQLSGGQQQRTAIARAIAHNPEFIIADEPTGALDSQTSREIMEIFQRLNKEKSVTIIMVTHDRSMARYCNRVFFMVDGVLEERLVIDDEISSTD